MVFNDLTLPIDKIPKRFRGAYARCVKHYTSSPTIRFWNKVKKGEPEQCWEWQAEVLTEKFPYGVFRPDGKRAKRILSHRFSWKITHGEIPQGLHVLHKCDNPRCVNPNHLFLGTDADNIRDMDNKGRRNQARGERIWSAILSKKDVIRIRQLYKTTKTTCRIIGAKYGVSKSCIQHIVSRQKWRHI